MNRLDELITPPRRHKAPTVAVAMANDGEVIRCIGRATRARLVRFILIGPREKILEVARANRVALGDAEFIDERDDVRACACAARLVCEQRAGILMKGLVHTAVFTRALLNKELDLVPEGNLVSHTAIFDIERYHKLLLMTDGGINIDPDVPRKAAILKNAIAWRTALAFGNRKWRSFRRSRKSTRKSGARWMPGNWCAWRSRGCLEMRW